MNKINPKILVVGDIILDHYLSGDTNRISPEAPVPIVEFTEEKWVLGGAANVANNLNSIGADVTLSGIIGDDENGDIVRKILIHKGINEQFISSKSRRTTIKTRVISENHQLLRIDKEDRFSINKYEEIELIEKFSLNINEFDCVIISDYNKGLLTNTFIKTIIDLSHKSKIKVFIDPKQPPFAKYSGAYLVKPNRKEAMQETGIFIDNEKSFSIVANQIQESTNCEAVVITLSEDGVGLFEKGKTKILPTKAKEIFDVTGAGDTFIATLVYSMARGKSLEESCEIANFASGIVVGKHGCVPIEYKEIEAKF
ncbi:D-glycero-beta-D-manno-heptose-7-phosphate kinase [Aquirufa lenticrescens]|uniref:D-glycero-beta-D-manno-heptose-7-phosphate kinase n=1 Tax=Aquirufa lenticrescens TaxID=2696560 RepID=UPI001CAA42CF|nr:D-glycero-beta-D-manno-heptose-7-phosphate kinase [Aquirufa lenticrescens]UAJ14206.1 D-glycero-beta-D-manno-heptose-7-phosphate kinase [Aquirufa lenticrescens]